MVSDENNQQISINVQLPGRVVSAKVWKANVGRITLYLLDTDVESNLPADRKISAKLYGGGKKTRIEQENVLGMGGVQLLEDKLNIKPSVYHLNEGHCGFLLFERIRRFMLRNGFSFQKAREMIKATSVFTTHTPVPAGNETFDMGLMQEHFKDFAPEISVPFEELIELGRANSDGHNSSFSMTVLALKLTSLANGVSKLHGEVCKDMWQGVWDQLDRNEVPITSVTNGIHVTSWIGDEMKRMFSQYLDINWDNNQDDTVTWLGVDQIPDKTLWYVHKSQKKRMLDYLKEKLYEDYSRRGESPKFINESLDKLNPDALTIGFARRFATYKRATLLFRHRESLINLLSDEKRPIQIIFAGKAHPADMEGKKLIQRIIEESRTEEFKGKIFYVENYNIKVAKYMTQGVDVWMNTPVRPHEASGTSGMKVLANGGINCSILDGWWDEGYTEEVGFAIKSSAIPLNRDHQDELDNNAIFNSLINEIIPSFYDLNKDDVPPKWLKMMKEGFKHLVPEFSTMRMVDEYHRRLYLPTAERGYKLSQNDYKGISELTKWKRSLKARFSTVQIEQVVIKGLDSDMLPPNRPLEIEMTVIPGRMKKDELQAELIIGQEGENGFASSPDTVALTLVEGADPTVFTYTLSLKLNYGGILRYAVRVVPSNKMLTCTQETGLVHWA
jgi:alpha-glucan phosphorylase-like protein